MNTCPITEDFLDRCLAGLLSQKEIDEGREHLASQCSDCDGFFESMGEESQENLIALFLARPSSTPDVPPPPLSDEEKERMWKDIAADTRGRQEKRKPERLLYLNNLSRPLALAAGVILVVAAVFMAGRLVPPRQDQYIKGGAGAYEGDIFLQFIVSERGGSPDGLAAFKRGVNRGVYGKGGYILFRYEIDRPLWVYLIHLDQEGAARLLYPADRDEDRLRAAGVYDVNKGEEVLALPLEGMDGLQTFCAVGQKERAAEGGELPGSVAERVTRLANESGSRPGRVRESGMDCFQIKVE